MEHARLERVEIDGVTCESRSALVATGDRGQAPTVLIHGILDNVWRWITVSEAQRHGIDLPDHRLAPPAFDPSKTRFGRLGKLLRLFEGRGLLQRFIDEGMPALAYGYQDERTPVADMSDAVETLHRSIAWATERFDAPRVNLVGHSRGGIVCRHALLFDSPFMKAARCRSLVDRLVAVCTPHRGSRLAEASAPIVEAITGAERFASRIRRWRPVVSDEALRSAERFKQFVTNLSQLTPQASEIQAAATALLPDLPGGYFAIAGDVPTFLRADFPMLGAVRLPPSLPIPELTDGAGDMAVSVDSALDIPNRNATNSRVFPVNHMTVTLDRQVQDTVIDWLRSGEE